eukprot:2311178-Pyramimonas_sp.AAC.1
MARSYVRQPLSLPAQAQDEFSSVPHGAVVMDFEKAHEFHFTQFGLEAGKCKNYAENDVRQCMTRLHHCSEARMIQTPGRVKCNSAIMDR